MHRPWNGSRGGPAMPPGSVSTSACLPLVVLVPPAWRHRSRTASPTEGDAWNAPTEHRGVMVDEEQKFEYDVQLTRRPDDTLRALYPGMTVRSTEAQTALRRWVDGPEELSALLVEIGSLGLTLTDVHRVMSVEDADVGGSRRDQHRATSASSVGAGLYEVRVVGELGGSSLRYLKCTHYAVQKQTLVRLTL